MSLEIQDNKPQEEKKTIIEVPYNGAEVLKVCAWCDEENGIRHTGNVSHGMCPEHAAKEIEEMTRQTNQ